MAQKKKSPAKPYTRAFNVLAFAPDYDSPGRRDATGAFIPEAKAYLQAHYSTMSNLCLIEKKNKAMQRHAVIEFINKKAKEARKGPNGISGIGFFCHGLKNRIQFGISVRDVELLATTMAKYRDVFPTDVRVTFYACDSARNLDSGRRDDLQEFGGDGGFADSVRDALCRFGFRHCVVDSHTTPGHTTMNPHVRRFEGLGRATGGEGGYYLVHRKRDQRMWRTWNRRLKDKNDLLRYCFPYMNTGDIHDILLGEK